MAISTPRIINIWSDPAPTNEADPEESYNPLTVVQKQLALAADKLQLEPAIYEVLKEPQAVIEVNIPIKMNDGTVKVSKGWTAAYMTALERIAAAIRLRSWV